MNNEHQALGNKKRVIKKGVTKKQLLGLTGLLKRKGKGTQRAPRAGILMLGVAGEEMAG